MDESKISASIAKVDRMLDRVNKVIADEKPLLADTSYPRRAKARHTSPQGKGPSGTTESSGSVSSDAAVRPANLSMARRLQRDTGYSVTASGELTGNEMRISTPQPREGDDDPTGMWAAFESDFDDMVARMN